MDKVAINKEVQQIIFAIGRLKERELDSLKHIGLVNRLDKLQELSTNEYKALDRGSWRMTGFNEVKKNSLKTV